jgi:kinesin family protein 23
MILFFWNISNSNYSLMNEPFPPMEIFSPDDDVTIRNIIDYLEEFQRRREAIIHETDLLKQTFYRQLRDTSDEFNKLRDECNDFKYKLELKEKEQNKSESKIKALEKIINVNCRTPLTSTLVNKSQTPTLFTNSNGNSAVHNEKSSSATATTTITSSAGSSTSGIQSETPSTYRTTNRIGSSSSHRLMMQAGAQLPPIPNSQQTAQQQTPSSAISSTLACIGSNKYQSPISNSSESYVQEQVRLRNGVPVANKRNRRSRSAEVWLDHKPPNAAKIETVLQPKMRRKKSVSKLELNDAKKSSKYVLTHQQQDENGEVVTNLIKGNILKSPTGGANVIFTDVETLKVKTQDLAKSSRPYQVKIEPSEDRAVIEERVNKIFKN